MRRNDLVRAINAATIFVERAKAMADNKTDWLYINGDSLWSGGTAQTGAVRRASMELTRALVPVRRTR